MAVSFGLLALTLLADASAAAPKTVAKDDENKLICRRELVTGSLVKANRRCHTRKEWMRMADDTRRDTDAMAERSLLTTPR